MGGAIAAFMIIILALMGGILYGYTFFTETVNGLESELETARRRPVQTKIIEVKKKVTTTTVEIEEKLAPIGQLATYEYVYRGTEERSESRDVLGWSAWGTTNYISYTYTGVIKVGYDVEDIQVELDQENFIIYITLPQPRVLDNYWTDETESVEKNNITNPLSVADQLEFVREIKQRELEKAEDAGIYDLAEDQMRLLVTNFLGVFSDYQVVFAGDEEVPAEG